MGHFAILRKCSRYHHFDFVRIFVFCLLTSPALPSLAYPASPDGAKLRFEQPAAQVGELEKTVEQFSAQLKREGSNAAQGDALLGLERNLAAIKQVQANVATEESERNLEISAKMMESALILRALYAQNNIKLDPNSVIYKFYVKWAKDVAELNASLGISLVDPDAAAKKLLGANFDKLSESEKADLRAKLGALAELMKKDGTTALASEGAQKIISDLASRYGIGASGISEALASGHGGITGRDIVDASNPGGGNRMSINAGEKTAFSKLARAPRGSSSLGSAADSSSGLDAYAPLLFNSKGGTLSAGEVGSRDVGLIEEPDLGRYRDLLASGANVNGESLNFGEASADRGPASEDSGARHTGTGSRSAFFSPPTQNLSGTPGTAPMASFANPSANNSDPAATANSGGTPSTGTPSNSAGTTPTTPPVSSKPTTPAQTPDVVCPGGICPTKQTTPPARALATVPAATLQDIQMTLCKTAGACTTGSQAELAAYVAKNKDDEYFKQQVEARIAERAAAAVVADPTHAAASGAALDPEAAKKKLADANKEHRRRTDAFLGSKNFLAQAHALSGIKFETGDERPTCNLQNDFESSQDNPFKNFSGVRKLVEDHCSRPIRYQADNQANGKGCVTSNLVDNKVQEQRVLAGERDEASEDRFCMSCLRYLVGSAVLATKYERDVMGSVRNKKLKEVLRYNTAIDCTTIAAGKTETADELPMGARATHYYNQKLADEKAAKEKEIAKINEDKPTQPDSNASPSSSLLGKGLRGLTDSSSQKGVLNGLKNESASSAGLAGDHQSGSASPTNIPDSPDLKAEMGKVAAMKTSDCDESFRHRLAGVIKDAKKDSQKYSTLFDAILSKASQRPAVRAALQAPASQGSTSAEKPKVESTYQDPKAVLPPPSSKPDSPGSSLTPPALPLVRALASVGSPSPQSKPAGRALANTSAPAPATGAAGHTTAAARPAPSRASLAPRLFAQVLFAKMPKCVASEDHGFDPDVPTAPGGMLDPKDCVELGDPLTEDGKIRLAALNWWISHTPLEGKKSVAVQDSWRATASIYFAHQGLLKPSSGMNEDSKVLGGIMQQFQTCPAWRNLAVKGEQDYRKVAAACGSMEARYLEEHPDDKGARELTALLKSKKALNESDLSLTPLKEHVPNHPYDGGDRRPASLSPVLVDSTLLSQSDGNPNCAEVLNRYSFYLSTITMPMTIDSKNNSGETDLYQDWLKKGLAQENAIGHGSRVPASEASGGKR